MNVSLGITEVGMTLKQFVKEYREEIDAVIIAVCPNCKINNQERELWVMNDESLYSLARQSGVRI